MSSFRKLASVFTRRRWIDWLERMQLHRCFAALSRLCCCRANVHWKLSAHHIFNRVESCFDDILCGWIFPSLLLFYLNFRSIVSEERVLALEEKLINKKKQGFCSVNIKTRPLTHMHMVQLYIYVSDRILSHLRQHEQARKICPARPQQNNNHVKLIVTVTVLIATSGGRSKYHSSKGGSRRKSDEVV